MLTYDAIARASQEWSAMNRDPGMSLDEAGAQYGDHVLLQGVDATGLAEFAVEHAGRETGPFMDAYETTYGCEPTPEMLYAAVFSHAFMVGWIAARTSELPGT